MLQKAIESFSKITAKRATRDDDVVDQLQHYVVVGVLLSLAILVGAKSFVGSPIHCWTPKEYDKDHFQYYVDSYCWISQLYNVPFSEELPVSVNERMEETRDVSFYRWVMVMFMVQALMFEIPHLVWKTFKPFSGISLDRILAMSVKTQMLSEADRDTKLTNMASFLDKWLDTYRRFEQNPLSNFKSKVAGVIFCFGKRSGSYLTRLYLFTKALYFVNVIAQFEILSSFLGFNYWLYGSEVIAMLGDDSRWEDLDHFPRIGMCDFQIRQLQNVQRFTVQCVLSINLFLEKIYAVQWFVLLLLGIMTLVSLVKWTVEEVFTSRRERFLKKYIYMMEDHGDSIDRKLFKKFVRQYLRDDGIFVLRVLGNNTSDLMAFDLLKHLWLKYKKKCHKSDDDNNPDMKPLVNNSTLQS